MPQFARAQPILLLPLLPSFQSHIQLPMLNRKDEGQLLLHTFHINIDGTQKMPCMNCFVRCDQALFILVRFTTILQIQLYCL